MPIKTHNIHQTNELQFLGLSSEEDKFNPVLAKFPVEWHTRTETHKGENFTVATAISFLPLDDDLKNLFTLVSEANQVGQMVISSTGYSDPDPTGWVIGLTINFGKELARVMLSEGTVIYTWVDEAFVKLTLEDNPTRLVSDAGQTFENINGIFQLNLRPQYTTLDKQTLLDALREMCDERLSNLSVKEQNARKFLANAGALVEEAHASRLELETNSFFSNQT